MNIFNGCAFNFSGSKARHMSIIEGVLPKDKNLKICDVFNGGNSLGSQLPSSWSVTANDIESKTVELHQYLQHSVRLSSPEEVVVHIKSFAHSYVDKTKSKEGYSRLVSDYNKDQTPLGLYSLICSSFSNQIRYNSSGEWNLPTGARFMNPNMEKKLLRYLELLKGKDITFTNNDFRRVNFEEYDLVISDSPYYNTCAVYNSGWDFKDAINLMTKLDKYSEAGGRFLMFEELWSKGKPNTPLIEWATQFNIKQLGNSSDKSNYQRKGGKTQEVLIYNF
tara:strand:- start:38 stop:871 length:834 start_codon:yes stop_codon:yes gene_type:complete